MYGAFSLTQFWNVSQVLILNLKDDFVYGDNVFFIVLSWLQLALYAVMLWTFIQILFQRKTKDVLLGGLGRAALPWRKKQPAAAAQPAPEGEGVSDTTGGKVGSYRAQGCIDHGGT